MMLERYGRVAGRMAAMWQHIKTNRDGATAIEYGLIIALIAIALISSVGGLGDLVNQMYGMISGRTNDVASALPPN